MVSFCWLKKSGVYFPSWLVSDMLTLLPPFVTSVIRLTQNGDWQSHEFSLYRIFYGKCCKENNVKTSLRNSTKYSPHIHTHAYNQTHAYIYIYIYICVCVCVCLCVFRQHFFVNANFIKHNRHFMPTYFLLDPFEFQYYFYLIRGGELI